MSFLTKFFGQGGGGDFVKYEAIVKEVNELEAKFELLAVEELKAKTQELRDRLQGRLPAGRQETLDEILPEAFALTREAAKKTLGQRHFDAQIIGGVVLHEGKIAEMKTGEGKTLTATLAIYLNALTGDGVHVVTVNDYLSKRDANWMGAVFHALGLSVGCIQHEQSFLYEPVKIDKNEVTVEMQNLKLVSRREAYLADITYGTNNEFGFDYLRDNMVADLNEMAQRGHNFAIVDEVDSILIDEARTPLIISAPDEDSGKLYETFSKIAPRLAENDPSTDSGQGDYNLDEKMRAVTLTEAGIAKVEKILGLGNIYTEGGIKYVHHLEQALRAEVMFKRDRNYVVKNDEVIIVDEFTGRLMPGRRYSEGLHQALEAKEGVTVQKESRTLATITFQNYFRLYKKLSGMTGTAMTSAEEFSKVYKLEVVAVPTNQPMIREDMTDSVYRTETGKFIAVAREIKERHDLGQPVLIGTVSIEKNELLSQFLRQEGIPHELLNAKNHEREAQIIANAGRKGAVTAATNMAGRGVDIILGGRFEENPPQPSPKGGSNASGSPPLGGVRGDFVIDNWQKEHDEVVALGGLHIIGTERHEARRIDDQLRGRAGRQGDPGSSQFFVSFEDDLMRIFAPDRIKKLMEAMNIPEDQPIENRMIGRRFIASGGRFWKVRVCASRF
ncbi:MAG: Protein translocase subunit SecA [Parcubacteria group bacterium GW2011_GWA2_43_9b]|nr:MAG: Protein translocase subunit SecA [Parcubacteria group bacterium GW2011_GWA2_43_9b]